MLLGTVDLQRQIDAALQDPGRRATILAAVKQPQDTLISRAYRAYLKACRNYKRPKTISSDRGRLKGFFRHIKVSYVSQVTSTHINDYFSLRITRDGLKPATIHRIYEILHAFFAFGIKKQYCITNPADGIDEIPDIPEMDIRFLTLTDIEVCLRAVNEDIIGPLVATAIYAGLRREELCWLTLDDVYLQGERPVLRVRSKTVNSKFWTPKTKVNRTVPISQDLIKFLMPQVLKAGSGPWLFPSPEGSRWDPDNLGHRLADIMAAANLSWCFLDCRHTFGSHLAQKGVSILKIAKLMGNSPEIARKHYAHLMPEQMHEEVTFPRTDSSTPRDIGQTS